MPFLRRFTGERYGLLHVALAPFLLACLVYAGVPFHEFVRWDDGMLIYENPAIRGVTFQTVRWAFTHFDPELYIPLTFLSYQINYLLGGVQPFWFLATNVLLHALNAALVATLVWRLTGRSRVAAFCGLLFAAHPLHTEAVAWASGRKDLLSASFFFGAWIAYLRFASGGERRPYVHSLVLHFAGMLAKVMTATLPAVLLLETAVFRPRETARTARALAPHIALSVLLIAVAVVGKEHLVVATTFLQKLLMACLSTAFYLLQILCPLKFSLLYPFTDPIAITTPSVALAVVVVIALAASVLVLHRRMPVWTFCVLGYAGTLAPTFLNFSKGTDLDIYFASDRYAYIPSFFVFLLLALALDRLSAWLEAGGRLPRSVFWPVAACTVVVLSTFAWRQSATWQDTRTLFAHVIEVYPDASHVAHNNLGNMERLDGNLDAAVAEFTKALEIRPNPKTLTNLGAVYRKQGRLSEARAAYNRALALDPESAYARFGLALIAEQEGRIADAERLYGEALQRDGTLEEVSLNLGALLYRKGDKEGAVARYREALGKNPFLVQAHHNLGVALQSLGDTAGATAAFARAVSIAPDYIPARLNLGVLLANGEDIAGAKVQFKAVLRLQPDNAAAKRALEQLP